MNLPVFTLVPLLTAGMALAQNSAAQPQPEPEAPPAEAQPMVEETLDPEAQRLVDMLAGAWRTVDPVGEGDDHLVVRIAPFQSPTLGKLLYVESAREGDPWTATRQSLFKVYRFGDQLRLRTLDFRVEGGSEHLIGLWAAPDVFPGDSVNVDDVIATMDINMEASGDGFEGETPCPYPTREYDAVEMTSALEISADRIVTKDTFYGKDGSVVAGAGVTSEPSGIEWAPIESDVMVERSEDGLVQIILAEAPADAEEPEEGANVYVHYSGWLTDGTPFDSSRVRGVAYRFVYPGQFIEGWSRAIAEMGVGSRRKLVIPAALGYGDRPMRTIPPNSTLIFDVEMLKIDPPTEPAAGEGAAGANQPGAAGGGGGGGDNSAGGG